MANMHPRQLKPLLARLLAKPRLAPVFGRAISVGLSRYEGQPIAFSHTEHGFRYAFSNGAVIYTTELDLLTPRRLLAEAEMYYLRHTELTAGNVVVDAGASIGTFVYVAAVAVGPTGRVLAIESHPETFRRLKQGVEESGFDNIDCIHAALVGADGEVIVSTADDYRLSSVSLTNSDANGAEKDGTSVRAVTLDTLAAEFRLDHIDLLKMNIEGAETEALRGAAGLAASDRIRAVAVSCHDFMADQTGDEGYRTRAATTEWLNLHNFDVRWGSEFSDESPIRDYAWAVRR